MALRLTKKQYNNYLLMHAHLLKTQDSPLLCPADKEEAIRQKLENGVPCKQILTDVKTSYFTIQRIRKKYGFWGH